MDVDLIDVFSVEDAMSVEFQNGFCYPLQKERNLGWLLYNQVFTLVTVH